MSFLIRLFYGNKIRGEVKEYLKNKTPDAQRLDDSVNNIFEENKWTGGFLESSKKAAIKTILKDELMSEKAAMRTGLLLRAKSIMKEKNFKFPLQPNEAEYLCTELRKMPEYAIYSPDEILYHLRIRSVMEKGKIERKGAVDLHTSYIEELKKNKEDFHELTKMISTITGKTQEEVDREVYRAVFNKEPTDLKYKEVFKALQTVSREHRFQAYRKMIDFARLIETTKSLSNEDAIAFDKIGADKANEEVKTKNLSKYGFFYGQLVKQVEDVEDNPFYERFVKKLMEAFESNFKIPNLENNRTPKNFRSILEKLSKKPFENLDTICSLREMNTNLKEVIPYLYQITTESAKRIQKFLQDPSDSNLECLTNEDQKHLLLLAYFLIPNGSIKFQPIASENLNWKTLDGYLPHRNEFGTSIDNAIVTQLYKLKQDYIFLSVYENAIVKVIQNKKMRSAVKDEIMNKFDKAKKKPSQLNIAKEEIKAILPESEITTEPLTIINTFVFDSNRNPTISIWLSKSNEKVIPGVITQKIDDKNKKLTADEQEEKEAEVKTNKLAIYLKAFAGNDDELFLVLQCAVGQTLRGTINRELSYLALSENKLLELSPVLPLIEVTQQTLNRLDANSIECKMLSNLKWRSSITMSEIEKSPIKSIEANLIINKNAEGKWVLKDLTIKEPLTPPPSSVDQKGKDAEATKEAAKLIDVPPEEGPPSPPKKPEKIGKQEVSDEE